MFQKSYADINKFTKTTIIFVSMLAEDATLSHYKNFSQSKTLVGEIGPDCCFFKNKKKNMVSKKCGAHVSKHKRVLSGMLGCPNEAKASKFRYKEQTFN